MHAAEASEGHGLSWRGKLVSLELAAIGTVRQSERREAGDDLDVRIALQRQYSAQAPHRASSRIHRVEPRRDAAVPHQDDRRPFLPGEGASAVAACQVTTAVVMAAVGVSNARQRAAHRYPLKRRLIIGPAVRGHAQLDGPSACLSNDAGRWIDLRYGPERPASLSEPAVEHPRVDVVHGR